MNNIYNYSDKIRNHIRKKEELDNSFAVLCAALDTISDCNDAIYSYVHLDKKTGRGINYVYIYGVIHILDVQTDAVKVIYEYLLNKKLNIKLNIKPYLMAVTLLRNKIFSHQVKIRNNQIEGFGIIAGTLSSHSFQPYSFINPYSSERKEIIDMVNNLARNHENNHHLCIEMIPLIENHQNELAIILKEICDTLGTRNHNDRV